MGLDQYWVLKPTKEEEAFALVTGEQTLRHDIGYHRKFWPLHEFLRQYAQTEDFNCEDLLITKEIYKALLVFDETQNNHELTRVLKEVNRFMNEGREVIYYGWY